MSDKEEYLKRLDKIQRDLDWIIQYLLKRDEPKSLPPYNPYNPNYPGIGVSNALTCGKCGLNFSGTTNYACHIPDCPTFVRTTFSYHADIPLDPDDRACEYSGDGRRVPKGEAE